MMAHPLSVEEVRQKLRERLTPLSQLERVFVRQALGRVLGQDIISPINVPACDNSAVDGYALRSADLPRACSQGLPVGGSATAGTPLGQALPQGHCLRIMTGAVLPAGLDVVVMQEKVSFLEGRVKVPDDSHPGQNLRRAGEDLTCGGRALVTGMRLRPADLGLIASLGIAEIMVYRRLRVSFFSTGNELQSLGEPPKKEGVYDSNRYVLYGLLQAMGCEVVDMGVVRDDPDRLQEAFRQAMVHSDVLLTSGGVSVGETDFTKDILAKTGEMLFWQVAMKPGRPLAFGRLGSCWFFGLPGNPVAVMVTFHQIVRECLMRLMGINPVPPEPCFTVPCLSHLSKVPGRTEFQRGRLVKENGINQVESVGPQGSGILRSMSEANCYIVLPQEGGPVTPGETVTVMPFSAYD